MAETDSLVSDVIGVTSRSNYFATVFGGTVSGKSKERSYLPYAYDYNGNKTAEQVG
ncbi:hypothetical protein [Oceanobacillus manasiensis]|uniref:hypothetical protein n=1 Tax=Oceanobacillus manasiensis TaxID=586413 RepID=UPI0012EC746B|nr:hypothetical protein [Oceanobacillus manasiensis]